MHTKNLKGPGTLPPLRIGAAAAAWSSEARTEPLPESSGSTMISGQLESGLLLSRS
jgi:hypothetical protein